VEVARRALTSPSVVTLGVSNPRGYEASGEAAEFVVFRSGGIRPITVAYTLSGSAVAGEDFVPLAGEVHFPVGAKSVKIPVTPIQDGITLRPPIQRSLRHLRWRSNRTIARERAERPPGMPQQSASITAAASCSSPRRRRCRSKADGLPAQRQ